MSERSAARQRSREIQHGQASRRRSAAGAAAPVITSARVGRQAERSSAVFSLAKSERGLKRREAILRAATKEFMQKGYERASLRKIIRASGGSAETLYQQFGNKAGLFAAVVGEPRQRYLLFVGEPSGRPVDEELTEIALAFLESAVLPESISIVRMMVGESAAMPKVSRMIWELGPARFHVQLAKYFRRQAEAGVLNIPDAELAARQFIGVTRANLDVRIMCGVATGDPAELLRHARSGVDVFLNGARAVQRRDL